MFNMNDNAQVAVFIDYDNIEISASEKLGKDANVVSNPVIYNLSMLNLEQLFLLDPSIIYLNHGSFGASPKPVFENFLMRF